MSRRKKHAAHPNHERWLVSYADFITLMFAFFVVMYSAAQVDQQKVGKLALAIQVAFQDMGIFQTSNTRLPLATSEPMPFAEVQAVENVARTENLQKLVRPVEGQPSVEPRKATTLGNVQRELERVLGPEIARHTIAVEARREGLVVSLREVGFFASGSETLRPDSQAVVDRIGAALGSLPNPVRIEGHTDNVPINTARFASNWELSTARATVMIKLFIERYGFLPDRLSAGGYAEYHPVAGNDTPEGRAVNRRVDIVVLAALREAGSATRAAEAALPNLPLPQE